jgi:hypothetical protein
VAGRYECLVRLGLSSAIESLELDVVVQCNRCSLPYLSPGRNKVAVSTLDPKQLGGNLLVVTYAYRTGFRDCSYDQLCREGAQIGAAKHAEWSKTPFVVQKAFRAGDLPATFEIDVPTPKGKYPAYPRMLFLRREIIAPGGKLLPLPAGAVTPAVRPGESLKSLPNPFLVGTRHCS